MRTFKLLVSITVLAACAGGGPNEPTATDQRSRFPNLIDHGGAPTSDEDWSVMPFADQGAWFGFGLPADGPGAGVGAKRKPNQFG